MWLLLHQNLLRSESNVHEGVRGEMRVPAVCTSVERAASYVREAEELPLVQK